MKQNEEKHERDEINENLPLKPKNCMGCIATRTLPLAKWDMRPTPIERIEILILLESQAIFIVIS